MRKSFFPLILLVLFGAFFLLHGQVDREPRLVASASKETVEMSGFEQALGGGKQMMALSTKQLNLAVFAILAASVLLAMRRRPHLLLSRRRR